MFKSLSLKVIIFGFIFTFFSSFGQSFFLGLFNSSIRDALSITHGQFGSIYASATLLSSVVLVWIGKKIDDVNILKFASYVIIFLSASCFIFSKISSVIFLFIGIFLMRLAGQGLSSHTATTTISRFFEKNRGRALSTGWLGLSLAEFIMPVLIVFLLTFIEWRDIWVSISILVLIILPISTFILVKEVKLDTREESKLEDNNREIKEDFEKELIELEKMIDGYLDFARNEREEQMVDASLFKLLQQAAKTSDPKGESINITVPSNNIPIFPIQVQSIRRALINLFTNAVRYAGKANAQIQIFDDHTEVIIDDNGPGIPRDKRDEVILPFTRLDKSRNSKTGGTGLGLSIAKNSALNHGGELILEDSPLGGLRVRLLLPL